jgi:hypothetical protein
MKKIIFAALFAAIFSSCNLYHAASGGSIPKHRDMTRKQQKAVKRLAVYQVAFMAGFVYVITTLK